MDSGKADYVIQEVAGCGRFQVTLTFLVYFVGKCPSVFSMYFLIFSLYNPGWRCLDDITTDNGTISRTPASQNKPLGQNLEEHSNIQNNTGSAREFHGELQFDNCTLFHSCQNIQFDSVTSNLVSEWGLICDRSWIASFIVSSQMVGLLLGSLIVGQIGDSFGRKTTVYGAQVAMAALNLASMFSTSWQMMAVFRFLIGVVCCGNLTIVYVYVAEFVTIKWRARIVSFPYWSTTAILVVLVLIALKDWRHLLVVTVVLSVICFVPIVWVPESLRWLEVKGKTQRFLKAANKVTRVNGKTLPTMEEMTSAVQSETSTVQKKQKTYTVFHLFKKGYRLQTLIVALEWFSCSIWYYTINLGVYALYGNFYINLILVTVSEMPPNFIAMAMSKIFNRKSSKSIFLGILITSFATASGFSASQNVPLKTTGVAVLAMITKSAVTGYWCFVYTQTAELYPTIVRSSAINYGQFFTRIGGAIVPFIIPNKKASAFISYAAMAALGLVCVLSILKLPETKGLPLKETFEDDDVGDMDYVHNDEDDVI